MRMTFDELEFFRFYPETSAKSPRIPKIALPLWGIFYNPQWKYLEKF